MGCMAGLIGRGRPVHEGGDAALPGLAHDLQKVAHAQAHQPDLNGQLWVQQAQPGCMDGFKGADSLWQGGRPCAHLQQQAPASL